MSLVGRELWPPGFFAESWKSDHADAMRCHDLESILLEGVMVFQLVESLNRSWRERVYRGVEWFAIEEERFIKDTTLGGFKSPTK